VEKYCTVGQDTDDNMAHAYCMLDTSATNTYSQYVTAITVTRTGLVVTLYVHCLSCFDTASAYITLNREKQFPTH
jgi:hypothetical protein